MRVLDSARSNLVPLLARVLLFLAFVPVGWHHAMEQGLFSGPQAERLRELGIASTADGGPSALRVARQDEPPLVADGWASGEVQTRALHELTLAIDGLGIPAPHVSAWVLTVFELVGGALLLVGLFSRIWAAGLLVWLVALFALESWRPSAAPGSSRRPSPRSARRSASSRWRCSRSSSCRRARAGGASTASSSAAPRASATTRRTSSPRRAAPPPGARDSAELPQNRRDAAKSRGCTVGCPA